jgi:hypothetical protein
MMPRRVWCRLLKSCYVGGPLAGAVGGTVLEAEAFGLGTWAVGFIDGTLAGLVLAALCMRLLGVEA